MNRSQLALRISSYIAVGSVLIGCGETNPAITPEPQESKAEANSTTATLIKEQVDADVDTKPTTDSSQEKSPALPKSTEKDKPEPKKKIKLGSLQVSALQELAERGNATACYLLGHRHEWGFDVPNDAMAAYRWVALAASRSEGVERILAMKELKRLSMPLTPTQIEQAGQPAREFWQQKLADLQKRAEEEDRQAQFELGLIYYSGDGFSTTERSAQLAKHLQKAQELLSLSSNKGHHGATVLLAMMITSIDTGSYTRPGELKRFADAKKSEGLLEAYRLLRLVASEENSRELTDIHEISKHMTPGELATVDENARSLLEEKTILLEKAAESGDGNPQFRLGLMFYLGKEIPRDLEASAEWLRKAGEHHNSEASALLAAMYLTGEGVEQDFSKVYKWYGISQTQGNAEAATHKTEVAKLLKPEEKAAAEEEVKAWLQDHPKKESE